MRRHLTALIPQNVNLLRTNRWTRLLFQQNASDVMQINLKAKLKLGHLRWEFKQATAKFYLDINMYRFFILQTAYRRQAMPST